MKTLSLFIPAQPAIPVLGMLSITLGGMLIPFILIVCFFSVSAGSLAIYTSLTTATLSWAFSLYLAGVRIVKRSEGVELQQGFAKACRSGYRSTFYKYCTLIFAILAISFFVAFLAASQYPNLNFYLAGLIFRPAHLLLTTIAFVFATGGFLCAYNETRRLAEPQSASDSTTN